MSAAAERAPRPRRRRRAKVIKLAAWKRARPAAAAGLRSHDDAGYRAWEAQRAAAAAVSVAIELKTPDATANAWSVVRRAWIAVEAYRADTFNHDYIDGDYARVLAFCADYGTVLLRFENMLHPLASLQQGQVIDLLEWLKERMKKDAR